MSYNIYQINDLNDQHVINILQKGIRPDMFKTPDIAKNYLYDHRDLSSNLFYILNNGRYLKGTYFVITDPNDVFLAAAGWNHYTDNIALALTRMIVDPKVRSQYIIGNEIMPMILEQTKNYKKVWITANDYNKTIYTWFERSYQNKSTSIANQWPEVYKKFKPVGQREVNHTLQWVVELENK